MTIPDLLVILKDRLGKFTCSIVNEDLTPENISYLRYNSVNGNWLTTPQEKIRVIDTNGLETYIFPSDYTVNATNGYIVFSIARSATEIIRADYSIAPFTDTELTSILNSALKQIRVLIFHAIDEGDISVNYSEAIIKRAFTIALREIQFPTTRYFAINIAGRSIDKSQQVTQIESLITSNEKDLLQDINALRYFDRTNILS